MDGGNKKIIDAQDFYELLDEIRRVFSQKSLQLLVASS